MAHPGNTGFSARKGKYTRRQLREILGGPRRQSGAHEYAGCMAGWSSLAKHFCPFLFTVKPVREAHVRSLPEWRSNRQSQVHGEELMRSYLTLIADSDEFEDDAAPGFLVNPFTHERMQLIDITPAEWRLSSMVQHYKPTEFRHATRRRKQQARDCINAMICRIEVFGLYGSSRGRPFRP